MKLGEKIVAIRKEHHLSQETFSELFHVTRQTVSNWETGKSTPDVEVLVKISEQFELSLDELLKAEGEVTTSLTSGMSSPNKKKGLLWKILLVIALISMGGIYRYQDQKEKISFELQQAKTVSVTEKGPLKVDTGYVTLPKRMKIDLTIKGDIDSGQLQIVIKNQETQQAVYQIKSDQLNEQQTIFLEKGAYDIQINADDYQEKVVSWDYQVTLKTP